MGKWNEAQVVKIVDETASTKRFWLKPPEGVKSDFIPGQFVMLDLPIHEVRQKRWRSYSIANAPSADGLIELCIVKLEGGAGSTYMFDSVAVGSAIKYKEPAGVFILKQPIARDLVLICTGTGVAPFRSMIQNIYQQKIAHQKIHLIFGTRTQADVLYLKEFEELAAAEDSFSYSVALSREECASDDRVELVKGYVHQVYESRYAAVRPDVQFLICGWQNMVDEAVANLDRMGYEKGQVKMELYG